MGTPHPLVAELDAIRVELGVTAEAVAVAAGVAVEEVAWWADGVRAPSLEQLVGYAAAVFRRVTVAGAEAPDDWRDDAAWLVAVVETRRVALGTPRSHIARVTGVSPTTVTRWGSGDLPSLLNFVAFVHAVDWVVQLAEMPASPAAAGPARPAAAKEEAAAEKHRPPHPLFAELDMRRIQLGLSRSAVARRPEYRLSRKAMERWSAGAVPRLDDLDGLARALGCEIGIVEMTDEAVPPQLLLRRNILREIEVARGNRDRQVQSRPSYPDGTGLQWRQAAVEALAEEVSAAARHQLTWALKARSLLGQALRVDDPARVRARVLRVAAVLVAWLEDLDARDDDAAPPGEGG